MSSRSLISVCLPVFNGAKHLSAAIESVLNQTKTDFELLIADDGSSDESLQIAKIFADKDKRIRFWTNDKRQGLFGNYNVCIGKAEGGYIKPFAQDDLLEPDALEIMSNVLDEEPGVVLVSSSRKIIDDAGQTTELKQPIKTDLRVKGNEVVVLNLINLNNWVGEPSTVMFRREFAGTGFDTAYFHYGDIEYWCRILLNGQYCYLQRPLASFRRHAASQTDKNHRELYFALDILRMSLSYRHLLSEFEPEDLMRRRIVEKIALELGHVAEANQGIFEYYKNAFLSDSGSEQCSLEDESAGFRLLAFLSLSTVSQLIAELDHEKRCRADEHEKFVVEVDKMRKSLYWKLSSPLRRMRDAIRTRGKNS